MIINSEKYLFQTVRIKYNAKGKHPCSRTGVVQAITLCNIIMLSLEDIDHEYSIKKENIKRIYHLKAID